MSSYASFHYFSSFKNVQSETPEGTSLDHIFINDINASTNSFFKLALKAAGTSFPWRYFKQMTV